MSAPRKKKDLRDNELTLWALLWVISRTSLGRVLDQ